MRVVDVPLSVLSQDLFAQAGTVISANIIRDKFTNQSRGFGFVEMSTEEEAGAAIQKFNGYELGGRTLVVNESRPQEKKSLGGGGGGGGRGPSGGHRRREPRW